MSDRVRLSRKTRAPHLYELYTWAPGAMAMSMNSFGLATPTAMSEYQPRGGSRAHHRPDCSLQGREGRLGSADQSGTTAISRTTLTPPVSRTSRRRPPRSPSVPAATVPNFQAVFTGRTFPARLKLSRIRRWAELTVDRRKLRYGQNLNMGQVQDCPFFDTSCSPNANTVRQRPYRLYHQCRGHAARPAWSTARRARSAEPTCGSSRKNVVERSALRTDYPNGYVLLNSETGYKWTNVRLDLGVQNVTNTLYTAPLGGFYFSGYKRFGADLGVPGMGRNFYAGLTYKF